MKILLLNPYQTKNTSKRTYPLEPIGLLSLATYVRDKITTKYPSIKISILDTYFNGPAVCRKNKDGYRSGLTDAEIAELLKEENPDIIGVSNNYTAYLQDSLSLIKLAKKTCPQALTIMGGAHATMDHKTLIADKDIDIVVRGEGEETLREIIYNIYRHKPLNNVAGITYKRSLRAYALKRSLKSELTSSPYKVGKRIACNLDRALIQNLDEMPIPDRSFIDYPGYLKKTADSFFVPAQKPVGIIFSARGCMYRCIFCSTNKVWANKWRSRSAKNILREINYLKEKYGVREIAFEDDQFMGSKKRIIELCKLIIKHKLGMSFIVPTGLSPALLDRDTIDYLKKANFYRICFSIDVGTKKSALYVRKPVNLDKVRDLIAYANNSGFWTYGFFVIGFPYEKIEDLIETRNYAYDLKLDFIRFYIAQPHMGSDLYDEYLKNGMLNERVNKYHTMYDSTFGTKYVSAKKLYKLRENFENSYLQYHLRHHFISISYLINEFIPKIFSLKKGLYFLRLLRFYNISNTK